VCKGCVKFYFVHPTRYSNLLTTNFKATDQNGPLQASLQYHYIIVVWYVPDVQSVVCPLVCVVLSLDPAATSLSRSIVPTVTSYIILQSSLLMIQSYQSLK